MFRKYASAEIIAHSEQHTGRTAGKKTLGSFDYEPRDDHKYLYVAVRACTADVPNLNYDMLPSSELKGKEAYKTFIGSYVYLNHDNTDPCKARGAIIDAKYHDEDPDDQWVEILEELDEEKCPKLCSLIRSGEIDTVSMGCEVTSTTCSICGNEAEYPFEYCDHIANKGQKFGGKLAYEICNGVDFFECSWVYNPADPTAYVQALDKTAACKTARGRIDYDDDIVIVTNPSGGIDYKGIHDDNPYRDDDWAYDRESETYYMPDHPGYVMEKIAGTKEAFPYKRLNEVVEKYLPVFSEQVEHGESDVNASMLCAGQAMMKYNLDVRQSEIVRRGLISVYYGIPKIGMGGRGRKMKGKTAVQTTFVPHWDMDYATVEYTVYQCDDLENCRWVFFDYDFAMSHGFDFEKYDLIYHGHYDLRGPSSIPDWSDKQFLELLYTEWNTGEAPKDAWNMRSLSMSDIVYLYGHYYYCDTFGWKEIDPYKKGEKVSSKHAGDDDEKEDSFANADRKPDDISTKEKEDVCPLCDSPSFDGEYCDICGYQVPPDGFDDIKLEDDSDYEEYESESDDGEDDDESEDVDMDEVEDEDAKEDEGMEKDASIMYDISDDPQVFIGIAEEYGDYDLIGFDIIKTDDYDLQIELEEAGAREL